MRKFLALAATVCSISIGLSTVQANASSPVVLKSAGAASAQWSTTGWKLGGLPAQSTLCVANGAADTGYPYEYVIEKINNPNFGPNIAVQNRCDGYSITNRMTIDWYTDSTSVCAKYTNTHRTWDAQQQKYIWDQNVVLWYNLSDYCVGDDTVRAHRTAMYMEYILGLQYDTSGNIDAVICATSWCYYNVKYVTYVDQNRLGYVYGQKV